MSKWYVL